MVIPSKPDRRSDTKAKLGNNLVSVIQDLMDSGGIESITVIFGQGLFFNLLERGYDIRVIVWRAGT